MKKIIRKISLEQFKNRFTKHSSASGLADDIIIDGNRLIPVELYGKIPVVKVGVSVGHDDGKIRFRDNEERYYSDVSQGAMERTVIRYRTMMDIFTFLKEFFANSVIYQLCSRKNGKKLVKVPFVSFLESHNEFIFSGTEPSIRSACIETDSDGSGNTYYVEDFDCDIQNANGIAVTISQGNLYNDGTNSRTVKNGICVGNFIWVNEHFEEFISYFKLDGDNGNLQAVSRAEDFMRFAEFNKKSTSGMEGFIPISLYIEGENEDMGVFTSVVSDWVPGRLYIIWDKVLDSDGIVWTLKKGSDIVKIPIPTNLNEFIKNALTTQDGFYRKYNGDNQTVINNPQYTYVEIGTEENYFVRPCYNGPLSDTDFWEKETDSSIISGITGVTESKLNTYRKSDVDDNGEPLPFMIAYDSQGNMIRVGTRAGEPIYATLPPFLCTSSITESNGVGEITFTYADNGTGQNSVIYTEIYPFKRVVEAFYVSLSEEGGSGDTLLFEYLDIDYSAREIYADRMYADFNLTIERDGTESQNVPYFKQEALFGIQDMSISASDIKIERGNSAAYERHSILGEVSSVEDLVKYKNGFFEVIDDENR